MVGEWSVIEEITFSAGSRSECTAKRKIVRVKGCFEVGGESWRTENSKDYLKVILYGPCHGKNEDDGEKERDVGGKGRN